MRLNIAIVQIDISNRKDENLKKTLNLIKGTILQGDIFILPELFLTNYETILKNVVREDDIFFTTFKKLSEEYPEKYFLTGSVPYKKDGNLFNSSFIFKKGKAYHLYDKIHLFPPMGEDKIFKSGKKLGIYRIRGKNFDLKIGVIICYDLRFPEISRILAKSGIDILLVPAQWPLVRISAFKNLIFSRAVENGIFVVGTNRVGLSSGEVFGGNSVVVTPTGEILNPEYFDERVIHVSINPEKYWKIKEKINPIKDINEEIYTLRSNVEVIEKKIW